MRRLFLLPALALPLLAAAQWDSVPSFPTAPPQLMEVGPPKARFNRKDAVMMVMRQTGILGQFQNPFDPALPTHFQFADVNGDTYPDALYPGTAATQRTFLAVMKDQQFVLWMDEPGALVAWDSVGSLVQFTLREDPKAPEQYLTHLRRFVLDKRTGKHSLLWQLAWHGNQLPQQTFEVPLLRIVTASASVRHTPEVKDEPLTDYNQDKKPDGRGNVLAILPPATRVRVLSAVKNGADDFVFVIAPARGLAPGHVLYGIQDKPAWVAGWVLATELADF